MRRIDFQDPSHDVDTFKAPQNTVIKFLCIFKILIFNIQIYLLILSTTHMSFELLLDPHTNSVVLRKTRKCSECRKRFVEKNNFYIGQTKRCKQCFDLLWMRKNDKRALLPLQYKIKYKVQRANARSRFRQSDGPELTVEEATKAWTGSCFNCSETLTFEWHPRKRNPNHAVIDRFDTSQNKSYGNGNFKWMCWACNDEKGAWDLVEQKNKEIERLQELLKQKQKRYIPYSSVLIQPNKISKHM